LLLLAESYRYGYNGKENDQESGLQDYGFRIYNPGLGRFWSVDPLSKTFPWYTPYQFAGNKPIWAIDLDGAEEKIVSEKLNDNEQFKSLLQIIESSKIIQSFHKQFEAQHNYVIIYTSFEPLRMNSSGVTYKDSNWKGSTTLISSENEFYNSYIAKNISFNEIEGYLENNKKVIIIGVSSNLITNKNGTTSENNSIATVQEEIESVWTLIHETIAHAKKYIDNPERSGNQDHKIFHGEFGPYSPLFQEIISNDIYKNTPARKLASKLMEYYKVEIFPIITKTYEVNEQDIKEE